MDPTTVPEKVVPLERVVGDTVGTRRWALVMMLLFAGLALGLSAVGIYGVMAYSVGQRTGEIGVRMAIGASRSSIFRLIVGQGLWTALLGVSIGLALGFFGSRLIQSLLFEVRAADWTVYLAIAATALGTALLACYLPAYRATRISPMTALREE